jgi:hypothetical protein
VEAIWRKLLKSKLTLGEQYDVVEVSFDNDLYRLTDDSNNKLVFKDKFH